MGYENTNEDKKTTLDENNTLDFLIDKKEETKETSNIDSLDSGEINMGVKEKKDFVFFKNKFFTEASHLNKKINTYLDSKGLLEQKEFLFFEIRDNIVLLGLFLLTIMLSYIVYMDLSSFNKEYEDKIQKINNIEKNIMLLNKKIELNNSYKKFSDILKYGTEIDGQKYPAGGYINEITQLFPTNLMFGTFTEGWTSDFVDWRGNKVRVPNKVLKDYKISSINDFSEDKREVVYDLKLEGDSKDIEKYLNIISGIKLVKKITSIKESMQNGQTVMDVKISFLIGKE